MKKECVLVLLIVLLSSSVIFGRTWVSLRDTTEGKAPDIEIVKSNDDTTEIIVKVNGFWYDDSTRGNDIFSPRSNAPALELLVA